MNEPWEAPNAPEDSEILIAVDPRVDADHTIGVLPCPKNPPPPDGWEYWKGPVAPNLVEFAIGMKKDSVRYPMGAFVQANIDGALVGARVEWHDLQGATGAHGCFRGVNLMRRKAPVSSTA